MPAAGQLAAFLDALRDSELLDAEGLNAVRRAPQAEGEDPRPLAQLIYQKGWLTKFQIKQVLKGHAKDLVLGPYRILDRVGEGGMGQVYKAQHVTMNRMVAL